jgi:hypothetical protein
MQTFLVFPCSDVSPEETFIVEASDEAEAKSKSLLFYSEDPFFQEYVKSFSVNSGFIEVFLDDERGFLYDEEFFYDYRVDLKKMNKK